MRMYTQTHTYIYIYIRVTFGEFDQSIATKAKRYPIENRSEKESKRSFEKSSQNEARCEVRGEKRNEIVASETTNIEKKK